MKAEAEGGSGRAGESGGYGSGGGGGGVGVVHDGNEIIEVEPGEELPRE